MADPNPQEDFSKLTTDLAALREDVAKLAESLAALARQEGAAAAETVKEKVRSGKAQAEATAAGLLDEGATAVQDAKACASAFCRDASGAIERNPFAAVIAALGIGFVFGLVSRGK